VKTPIWLYVISIVPPAILVTIGVVQPWIPPVELFRDPLSVAMDAGKDCCHIYYGFFSNLGVLLWCSAASVCFFASMVLVQRKVDRREILFMISAGLFTGLLLFDDLFQAHEIIYPKILGVDEIYVFAAYMIFTGVYLSFFRYLIVRNGYSLMLISLTLFAISIITDTFFESEEILRRITEDGTKFIGISSWTAFHFRAAWLLCTGSQHDFQRVS
jgi:hypothetical protein